MIYILIIARFIKQAAGVRPSFGIVIRSTLDPFFFVAPRHADIFLCVCSFSNVEPIQRKSATKKNFFAYKNVEHSWIPGSYWVVGVRTLLMQVCNFLSVLFVAWGASDEGRREGGLPRKTSSLLYK